MPRSRAEEALFRADKAKLPARYRGVILLCISLAQSDSTTFRAQRAPESYESSGSIPSIRRKELTTEYHLRR